MSAGGPSAEALDEAAEAVASLLRKCEASAARLPASGSRRTLMDRRVRALRLSLGLIETARKRDDLGRAGNP